MSAERVKHPLTPRVTLSGGHVRKVYVEKMGGKTRLLRPKWRASWGCWVVEDGGPQELFETARGFTTQRDRS